MNDKRGKSGRRRWLVYVLVLLGAAGCSSNRFTFFTERHNMLESTRAVRNATIIPPDVPRELDKHVLPTYLVEPGDVLLVVTSELDAPIRLPGDQAILPDGTISLGQYGRPVVAGKSIEEIEGIVQALVRTKTGGATISVRLVSRQSKVYYVLGEVNAPGAFPLTGRETVLDGIIAAGGVTDRASRQDIVLSRPTLPDACRVVLPVCYREIVQLGDTTTNYQLAPGDRIFVPSKSGWEDWFGCRHENTPCGKKQTPCGIRGCN